MCLCLCVCEVVQRGCVTLSVLTEFSNKDFHTFNIKYAISIFTIRL